MMIIGSWVCGHCRTPLDATGNCPICNPGKIMSPLNNPVNNPDPLFLDSPNKFDKVERPAHYTEGRKFETIEVIEDLGLGKGFCLGNALKYISRAGKKEGSSELEDLKKARWYLNRWITSLEAQSEKGCPSHPQASSL